MPNLEWEVAHDLISPAGTVLLNQTDVSSADTAGRRIQILPDGYKIVPSLRVTQDNLSQADGSVLHPRWKTGLVATFTARFVIQHITSEDDVDYIAACAEDLREMGDELAACVNALRRLTGTQRLIWTPTGAGSRRMLDEIQVLAWPDPTRDGVETGFTISIETPFPYAIDLTQTATDIADGGTETLTNAGTADFFPVVKVFGPFGAFVLTNETTGLELSYDDSRPGAVSVADGHYAEFDFFRGTVFLDGDSTDLIAGVDPAVTDFFPLVYLGGGTNDISITGADATVLWNLAWS